MRGDDWSAEIRLLEARGIALAPGLGPGEIARVEATHGFRFPPDLRAWLSIALPVGPGFPDWREPESEAVRRRVAWPFDGIAFEIENNDWWWERFGPRPAALAEALAVARAHVDAAPRLIPVYSHRFIPAQPEVAGNPVFSVHQTDIILYGRDLRRYLACELGTLTQREATLGARHIPFWTDIVDECP